MAGFPEFNLYASNGTTLIYNFEFTQDDSGNFRNPQTFVEHDAVRGQGSIIIPGTDQANDITLQFVLIGHGSSDSERYESLVEQMQEIEDLIVPFTPYILSIDVDESGSTKDYHVMFLGQIEWPLGDFKLRRVNFQRGIITFRKSVW